MSHQPKYNPTQQGKNNSKKTRIDNQLRQVFNVFHENNKDLHLKNTHQTHGRCIANYETTSTVRGKVCGYHAANSRTKTPRETR